MEGVSSLLRAGPQLHAGSRLGRPARQRRWRVRGLLGHLLSRGNERLHLLSGCLGPGPFPEKLRFCRDLSAFAWLVGCQALAHGLKRFGTGRSCGSRGWGQAWCSVGRPVWIRAWPGLCALWLYWAVGLLSQCCCKREPFLREGFARVPAGGEGPVPAPVALRAPGLAERPGRHNAPHCGRGQVGDGCQLGPFQPGASHSSQAT